MAHAFPNRFGDNPILIPADVPPTRSDFVVESLLNPGAFVYQDRVGLLIRVCERPPQEPGWAIVPIVDPDAADKVRILRFPTDDPRYAGGDPRLFRFEGETYLTTLSHLRLAWSSDGHRFDVETAPALVGEGELERYGIEDCRVSLIDGEYHLTYSAVSSAGVGVGLITTRDWKHYTRRGMVIAPANKDAAILEQKVNDQYVMLHRPSGVTLGGNYIWLARSPDLIHWGEHQCMLRTRPGMWDSSRIGAGAAPILTEEGWLEIYHGADDKHRYSLGAVLFDATDGRVIARSKQPLLEPDEHYETTGFFSNVVFTNGHVVRGDQLTVYYGAADTVICGVDFSIKEILASLRD